MLPTLNTCTVRILVHIQVVSDATAISGLLGFVNASLTSSQVCDICIRSTFSSCHMGVDDCWEGRLWYRRSV